MPNSTTAGLARAERQILARDLPRPQPSASPVQRQAKDNRAQPAYTPCTLTFLTGDLKGKDIDLGLAVESVSHSQQAYWEDHDNQTLRISANFTRVSHRDINLSVTFYALNDDVSHLGENLSHLQEIYPADYHPPLLLFKQGSLEANQCVCMGLNWKYDTPLPEDRGYRRCEAEISLKLLGGIDSPHALAPPLTGTPLSSEASQENTIQRDLAGNAEVAEKLFARCLGEDGAKSASGLIRDRKLNDVEEIEKLDSNTFVQLIIGGIINKTVLQDEQIKDKLKRDLAIVLASSEPGLSRVQVQKIANAILNQSPASLSGFDAAIYNSLISVFDIIFEALSNQNLGKNSSVFKQGTQAGNKIRELGACGLSLRKAGGEKIGNGSSSFPLDDDADKAKLDAINAFIASPQTTDEQIQERFELESSVQARNLKNNAPFSSKSDFWQRSSNATLGATGVVLWENFEQNE